jgi:thimet oligopeptidase
MITTQLFDFQNFTPEFATKVGEKVLADSQQKLATIYTIDATSRNFENTLLAYDNMIHELNSVASVTYLLFCTSPNENLRNVCSQVSQNIQQFVSELVLDEQLYKAVADYAYTHEANHLTGYKQKFLAELLRDFRQNGLALPPEEQTILKDFQARLIALENEFQKNIATYQDFVIATETDMEGLPQDYKQQHRLEDGSYKIGLSYPSYIPFMQYAANNDRRKELLIKYLNRGADKNLTVLQEVLQLRKQIAKMLGFESYAALRHDGLMTKTPAKVWKFELDLVEKVRQKAEIDYQELLQAKIDYLKLTSKDSTPTTDLENITEIKSWETAFYKNILMKTKYAVDNQEVKQYFELNQVLNGIFAITEKLFGVQFVEQTTINKNINTWHAEVRYFEVVENQKVIGKFYLDLFPRANKYNHAACFPLVSGKNIDGIHQDYQTPILALVCNFPPPSPEKPSLLTHNDVETLFHEFGHALHELLTQSPICSYAGTNTKRDFVEVPSQWFEAWAWHYDSLSLFAKHYQTQETLPKALFDKMLAAKNIGSGLFAQSQLFYGLYDLTLHDTFNPFGTETTTDVLRKLQNQYTLYPYIENTHFQAAFGHLMGYAACYYGYLWAKVYAEDCISIFEQQGMFNAKIGKKFKENILSKGGTVEEITQITDFLGREPEYQAFLQSLGL